VAARNIRTQQSTGLVKKKNQITTELLILRAITNPLRQRKHFSPSVVVETVIQVPAISVTMLSEYGPKVAWRDGGNQQTRFPCGANWATLPLWARMTNSSTRREAVQRWVRSYLKHHLRLKLTDISLDAWMI
jgi:hypothetical protein